MNIVSDDTGQSQQFTPMWETGSVPHPFYMGVLLPGLVVTHWLSDILSLNFQLQSLVCTQLLNMQVNKWLEVSNQILIGMFLAI